MSGQSKKAQRRRQRLGGSPEKPPTHVRAIPGLEFSPDPHDAPIAPTSTSAEKVAEYRRQAAANNARKAADHEAWKALSDDEQAAILAAKKQEWADLQAREEERKAEQQRLEDERAAEPPRPPLHADNPDIDPRLRRYLRVEEALAEAAELAREEAKTMAKRLEFIETGRRDALATEYAYPLPNADTTHADGAERPPTRANTEDPDSVDAVPVRWKIDSIAERSFVEMVASDLTISSRAAELLVQTSKFLHADFPAALALLGEGRTSYRHAKAIVDSSHLVPDENLAEYEGILLPFAETLTPPQFERKARAVAATYQDDPLEERHREALKDRSLTLTPAEDGMADLTLHTDAAALTGIYNRMRGIAFGLHSKTDERSMTQTTADIASELLLTGTTEEVGTPCMDALTFRDLENAKPARRGVFFEDVPNEDTNG
ncbi:MAG: DUF222 domain-containing protein, partial [Glaciihabitans sp.]